MRKKNYPMDKSTPHEILQHIMESSGILQADLVGIIGSSGVMSEVVNGKRSISKTQAKALGEHFKVSPSLFIWTLLNNFIFGVAQLKEELQHNSPS